MENQWPALSYDKGKDTYATLHMWTQIVGKIKLAVVPWINHSWHVTLHLTPTGLTTSDMPFKAKNFQIDFDFLDHQLKIITSDGEERKFDFYQKIMAELSDLKIDIKINSMPVEIENPIPFEKDTVHATYDKEQAHALHQALLKAQNVLTHMRCNFTGKCSPVHFFWGSFDLACTRFSGRTAPTHPGGAPNCADWVMEEGYSHELSSCGFWPGGGDEGAFYCYAYPAPDGFADHPVAPAGAFFSEEFGQFLLPYESVRQSSNPDQMVRDFLQTTYAAAADRGDWDRAALEIEPERLDHVRRR